MTCAEVNSYLDRSLQARIDPLPDGIRRHLEGCSRCRSVWEFMTRAEVPPELAGDVRSRIERRIEASLRPVRPLASGWKLALGFILVFVVASAVFVGVLGRRGLVGLDPLQLAGMLGIVGCATVLLAGSLSREMVPGEKRFVDLKILLVILLASMILAAVVLFPWRVGPQFLPSSWHCFRVGFLLSLPAAALILLLLRRGTVLSPGVTGAAVGLLSGLVGVTVLHFGCHMHTAPHIALSHLGIAFLGALFGYFLGHYLSLLRPRRD